MKTNDMKIRSSRSATERCYPDAPGNTRRRPRPRLSADLDRLWKGREGPCAWLLAVGLAVVMTAPLALHLRSGVSDSLDDPLLQAWQVAWGGHALLHQPLPLFDANAFWPEQHSLAFSDSLLGYAPSALLGRGPDTAVLR